MTLIEIMVVVALIALVMGVSVPTLRGVLDAEQAGAARELVMTYRYLRDEAALRNVTFRVAYNLDARTYKVEVGEPGYEHREDLQSGGSLRRRSRTSWTASPTARSRRGSPTTSRPGRGASRG